MKGGKGMADKQGRLTQEEVLSRVNIVSLISEFEEVFDIMFDPEDIMEMTSYTKGKELLAKYDVVL